MCEAIDCSEAITVSRDQFESLLYSYRMGVMDRKKPFKILFSTARNYLPLMKDLKQMLPNVFKEEPDGEIILQGEGFES